MEKIYRDASIILSTGTVQKPGYEPVLTPEVLGEVTRHGLSLDSNTYTLDTPALKYSDFTVVSTNTSVISYMHNTHSGTFWIYRYPRGSDFHSLCGNQNHEAEVVIYNSIGRQFGICAQLSKEGSRDFSLIQKAIFRENNPIDFEMPRDKCLGPTLKAIVNNQ